MPEPLKERKSMAVSIAIFNAGMQSVTVIVNNGPQTLIPGTSPAQNWQPQTQAPGTGPSYSPGYPAPNVLGNAGPNQVQVYVAGSPIGGRPFQFSLPNNFPIGSVQIYLFFSNERNTSWLVLADGAICAQGNIAFGAAAESEE
jgi:hypothetical protein